MRVPRAAFALILLLLLALPASLPGPTHLASAAAADAKAKTVYFQNATAVIGGSSEFLMNTSLPLTHEVVDQSLSTPLTYRWFLDPPLAGDLVLNGTVRAFLWVRYLDAKGDGTTFMTLGLGLYAHMDGNVTTILDEGAAANQDTHSFVTSHFSEYAVSAELSEETVVPAGSRLEVVLLLESNATVTKRIAWGSEDFPSRLALPAVSRIQVDDIRALNGTGEAPPYFEAEDSVTFNATVTDPFGGYDVVWANLTLEAPDGSLLFDGETMARTSGNDSSFTITFELDWPDTPKTKGTYNVTVEVVDRTGFHYRFPDRPGDETFGGHLEARTETLSVGEVLWANFLLQDSLDQALEGAILRLWDGDALAAEGTSNATGGVNLTQVPGAGTYTARAWWQAVPVLEQSVDLAGPVDAGDPIVLTLAVFSPTLEVIDAGGASLADATVFITHPNGSVLDPRTSDEQGRVSLLRTAGGAYTLQILWSGTEVGVKGVLVDANGVLRVLADVFYLTVWTRDRADAAVSGVHVTATDLARALIADSQLSDADGRVTARLPRGQYRIEATWLGAPVGTEDALSLTANRTLDLSLDIHNVRLVLVDNQGEPVEDARIEALLAGFRASGTTDDDGSLSLQLPGGNLTLRAWWEGVLVYEAEHGVDADTSPMTLETRVYHVTLQAVDREGRPLAGVSLILYRGEAVVDAGVTGPDGTYVLRQPEGSYRVVAHLETTHLLTDVDQTVEASFEVPSEDGIELRFAAFAPPITGTNLFYVATGLGGGVVALLGFLFLRRRGVLGGKDAGDRS